MKIEKKQLVKIIKEQLDGKNINSEVIEFLEEVVDIWGREYGKGKKYSETTVGGRLIGKIEKWLALNKKKFLKKK